LNLPEQIDRLGFAVLPSVVGIQKISTLIDELKSAIIMRSKAGARHLMCHGCVASLANGNELLSLAREILGNDAAPFRATHFDKSPTSNWLVTWHQDTALPLRERLDRPGWGPWSVKGGVVYAHAPAFALEQVLAIRLHLDDSTPLNGVLRVLPGTHKSGVLTDEQIHVAASQTTPIESVAPRGAVLAMRPLLVHASSKSQSEERRRVLHIEYSAVRQFADGLELAVA
jgi:ectoine hydroxylase-related dioxygenase (phytanoyl-CoA dioxygenase family)